MRRKDPLSQHTMPVAVASPPPPPPSAPDLDMFTLPLLPSLPLGLDLDLDAHLRMQADVDRPQWDGAVSGSPSVLDDGILEDMKAGEEPCRVAGGRRDADVAGDICERDGHAMALVCNSRKRWAGAVERERW